MMNCFQFFVFSLFSLQNFLVFKVKYDESRLKFCMLLSLKVNKSLSFNYVIISIFYCLFLIFNFSLQVSNLSLEFNNCFTLLINQLIQLFYLDFSILKFDSSRLANDYLIKQLFLSLLKFNKFFIIKVSKVTFFIFQLLNCDLKVRILNF